MGTAFFNSILVFLLSSMMFAGQTTIIPQFILFRIVLPLSLPALVTVGRLAFMGAWNNFVGPYVFLESESNLTVPLAIQSYQVRGPVDYAGRSAAVMISILPVVVVFILLRRWFLRGLSLGALKG